MINIYLILLIFYTTTFALDIDLDGVDDSVDRCLDTSFDDLVDIHGCPLENRYIGKIDLELKYNVTHQEKYEYIYINYKYNRYNIFIDGYKDIYSLSFGYTYDYKDISLDMYAGLDTKSRLFSLLEFDYFYYNYTYYLSTYYTFDDKLFHNSLGLSYLYNQLYIFDLSYKNNNRGLSDSYHGVEALITYLYNEKLFLKFGYEKSLKNDRVDKISFSVGFSFE